jgi:hypothetical protein
MLFIFDRNAERFEPSDKIIPLREQRVISDERNDLGGVGGHALDQGLVIYMA